MSSWCRASVEKEHFFPKRHPALSFLSATKDEEGERWHLIDGGLRMKNLRQRTSRLHSSLIWDIREESPSGSGHLRDAAAWTHRVTSPLPIFPIHFPPHYLVYFCEVRERRKDCFPFLHTLLLFYVQVLLVSFFAPELMMAKSFVEVRLKNNTCYG